MGALSISHLLILLVVVLLLFGTGKVSSLMGEFGKGIKTFKQNVADDSKPPVQDAAMTPPGTLNAPLEQKIPNSTINQG